MTAQMLGMVALVWSAQASCCRVEWHYAEITSGDSVVMDPEGIVYAGEDYPNSACTNSKMMACIDIPALKFAIPKNFDLYSKWKYEGMEFQALSLYTDSSADLVFRIHGHDEVYSYSYLYSKRRGLLLIWKRKGDFSYVYSLVDSVGYPICYDKGQRRVWRPGLSDSVTRPED